MSVETDIARLDERIKAHQSADEDVHDRVLSELSKVGKQIEDLTKAFTDLRVLAAPIIEDYLANHPSKVQNMPTFSVAKTPSTPPSYKVDARKLGLTVGGFFAAIELWMQVHSALAGWLKH